MPGTQPLASRISQLRLHLCSRRSRGRSGFTLVELLTATTLSIIMLTSVMAILAAISRSMNDTRSILETADRLRAARNLLQKDLAGVTVTMSPPRRPEFNEGYFEYIEGPLGVRTPVWDHNDLANPPMRRSFARNADTGEPDSTVTDFDDILMFTTRNLDRPFIGRLASGAGSLESPVAEVAWFVRGRTLYRRVLLVAPHVLSLTDANTNGVIDLAELGGQSIFNLADVSVRPVFNPNLVGWVPNSLGDLTNRRNRFAHWVHGTQLFPYDASFWGLLGLPLLEECSHPAWMMWTSTTQVPIGPRPGIQDAAESGSLVWTDLWTDPHRWGTVSTPQLVDPMTGVLGNFQGPRVGAEVVLTNVIGFDIKAWDPWAPIILGPGGIALYPGDPGYPGTGPQIQIATGAYVDLGYGGLSWFGGPGDLRSGLSKVDQQNVPLRDGTAIYDTWSFYYEHDGEDQFQDGRVDLGTNGFDDNGNGVVDDPPEFETSPPYPYPLRGIQVKIRVFEPDTKQIREVTLVQDFVSG